ncbi:hypothetical protein V6N11_064400 [Hibiscus sabdariffa]|uniref:DUF4283 domain-containing protein n=1 Tax=Hibiscus sabdariffa TaxID=183260 RepID=A0ABR2PNI3_9ROSI
MQTSMAILSESEELMDEDDIVIEEGDIVRKKINGVISIDFLERILSLAKKSLDHTVVVKLLGRRIGYNTLRNKIYELWKPSQPIKLMDIENDYFLVSFRAHLDYKRILSSGPWTGSRFNPLRVSEENVDDALPVPTDPLAEVPIQQSHVVNLVDFPALTRNQSKANSSSHPHLDQLRHTAVVIDENSDLNVVLFPKDSTSLPQYDHNSPMGDPPDIPAPTSPLPSHRISLDINMQPKQIDEAYDALDPAQAVAMLK